MLTGQLSLSAVFDVEKYLLGGLVGLFQFSVQLSYLLYSEIPG